MEDCSFFGQRGFIKIGKVQSPKGNTQGPTSIITGVKFNAVSLNIQTSMQRLRQKTTNLKQTEIKRLRPPTRERHTQFLFCPRFYKS